MVLQVAIMGIWLLSHHQLFTELPGASMSKATETIKGKLAVQQYIASDRMATVLYLAEELGKPILCEGPAGVGKTELSKAWAEVTNRRFIRLQCYEGLDESKALY